MAVAQHYAKIRTKITAELTKLEIQIYSPDDSETLYIPLKYYWNKSNPKKKDVKYFLNKEVLRE